MHHSDFICACCEWALFVEDADADDLCVVRFACGCPRVAVVDGRQCAYLRQREPWSEYLSADVIVHD